jgi:DNA-binding response OmpR family regulator
MPTVLIVEDDAALAVALRDGFEYEGYRVLVAADGETGLKLASSKELDAIVLDIMLPSKSGFDLCNQLRKTGNGVPIVFLSARSGEADKILGLKTGADDYVTKPFSFMELVARVEALLRRVSRPQQHSDTCRFGDVELNFRTREAKRRGKPLDLSAREFEILDYLMQHRGQVVSRNQLLDSVWGYEEYPFTRTVDVHISKLRRKIEDDPAEPRYLITVHRTGYKFLPRENE